MSEDAQANGEGPSDGAAKKPTASEKKVLDRVPSAARGTSQQAKDPKPQDSDTKKIDEAEAKPQKSSAKPSFQALMKERLAAQKAAIANRAQKSADADAESSSSSSSDEEEDPKVQTEKPRVVLKSRAEAKADRRRKNEVENWAPGASSARGGAPPPLTTTSSTQLTVPPGSIILPSAAHLQRGIETGEIRLVMDPAGGQRWMQPGDQSVGQGWMQPALAQPAAPAAPVQAPHKWAQVGKKEGADLGTGTEEGGYVGNRSRAASLREK